jgi:D-alanyl-D-alanine carboxypeptidase
VTGRLSAAARFWLQSFIFVLAIATAPLTALAAPYAAFVMDARTGEVIHSRNADTPLHPASLTKMMTLYIAFQAIERGEISLDTEVRIDGLAASEPPSRLGLQEGQTIRLRYLLRAAAIRSANDAATAIGIALGGSEAGFAERMNATAAAMGMDNTHFLNANGLTQDGHYSTARDMSVLGRHLIYDFPQYYNLFSRRSADAGLAEVANTNRRFLDAYEGADGIKTGYTVAAGYNLTASAERNGVRIIATVFGGTSTANRNARIMELLDMGFAAADPGAQAVALADPGYAAPAADTASEIIVGSTEPVTGAAAHTLRVNGLIQTALRPLPRPGATDDLLAAAVADAVEDAMAASVDDALSEALGLTGDESASAAPLDTAPPTEDLALAPPALDDLTDIEDVAAFAPEAAPEPDPEPEPTEIIMTAEAIAPAPEAEIATETVATLSTSGATDWGINVGRFPSRNAAERELLQVFLSEASALMGGVRRVQSGSQGYDAVVVGLSRDAADLACRRLQARNMTCFMMGS